MPGSTNTNRRYTLLITLLTAGVFVLGAGLIPFLVKSQQAGLNHVEPLLPPTFLDLSAKKLELTDLQGNRVWAESYRGKVVLINNWATWCPAYEVEMPELLAYYDANAEDGLVILAIDSGDPASQVATFVKDHGMTFPIWFDPQNESKGFFKNWYLPISYVFNKPGMVRLSWTGGINQAT